MIFMEKHRNIMSDKNNPIKELATMLNENEKRARKKTLLEGYLSEDDFDQPMQGEKILQQDFGNEDEDFPPEGKSDTMAKAQGILPIKNEIDQIRQIALRTIARLAEDPTAESYQMMKKIWMMCDKAIEAALNPYDGGK